MIDADRKRAVMPDSWPKNQRAISRKLLTDKEAKRLFKAFTNTVQTMAKTLKGKINLWRIKTTLPKITLLVQTTNLLENMNMKLTCQIHHMPLCKTLVNQLEAIQTV